MVEAISSLARSQRQAQRQAQAVRVLVMYAAKREVKDRLRREGKVKLSRVPHREITTLAKARLFEDGEYRARLIAEARPIVDQWTAEGFFGKLAALSVRNVPELRILAVDEGHAQWTRWGRGMCEGWSLEIGAAFRGQSCARTERTIRQRGLRR